MGRCEERSDMAIRVLNSSFYADSVIIATLRLRDYSAEWSRDRRESFRAIIAYFTAFLIN